jgi:hypothetical protein
MKYRVKLHRRKLLVAIQGIAFLAPLLFAHPAHAQVVIVHAGKAQATILLPAGASEQLRVVGATLADYLKQASGAVVPVLEEAAAPAQDSGQFILLGQTKHRPVVFPGGFDDDGFIIAANGRAISICGPTDHGTEFGVYEFLERYVGVRWLLPGEHGTDVPRSETISVPEGLAQVQPVAFSRMLAGLANPQQHAWARFNRMRGRVEFHHNLHSLFPPVKYTAAHPEFFPMKDGRTRYLPDDTVAHGWQPCFTAPGLVQEAVRNIREYFDKNPAATYYSLGANDSGGYCRCPSCLAKTEPDKTNFLGFKDYSDLYYQWCNQVIEGVLKYHPDKRFGCLAYSEVAAPPTRVKVHPRLLPFLTFDRMGWVNPEAEAIGHEITEAWAKVSPAIGWYDYAYGTPYRVPRVYFHQSGEYLSYGARHGVKAQFAELYPNWGEGPKPFVFLRLWWNPGQDVDALLTEWYERCVGPKAAPDLAKYFALWESFWTTRILKNRWFSTNRQYLPFYNTSYLGDVTREDIAECRRLLDAVTSKCETPPQRARAKILEQAFRYYEASALEYLAEKELPERIDSQSSALQHLRSTATILDTYRERRYLTQEVFLRDPVLVHPIPMDTLVSGKATRSGSILPVVDWVIGGDPAVRRAVAELAMSDLPVVAGQARTMLEIADGRAALLTVNPSFELGDSSWRLCTDPLHCTGAGAGPLVVSGVHAHTGNSSALLERMTSGGPVQQVVFPGPGRFLAMAWVYSPPQQRTTQCTVALRLTPRDERGTMLSPITSTPVRPTPGAWEFIALEAEIPERVYKRKIRSLVLFPIADNLGAGRLYIDDVRLYRLN